MTTKQSVLAISAVHWEMESRDWQTGRLLQGLKTPALILLEVQVVQAGGEQEFCSPYLFVSLGDDAVAGSGGISSSKEGTVQGLWTALGVFLRVGFLLGYRATDLGQQSFLHRVSAALPGFHSPQGSQSAWRGTSGLAAGQREVRVWAALDMLGGKMRGWPASNYCVGSCAPAWMLVPVWVAFESCGPFLREVCIHGCLTLHFAVNLPSKMFSSGPHFLCLGSLEIELTSFLLLVMVRTLQCLLSISWTESYSPMMGNLEHIQNCLFGLRKFLLPHIWCTGLTLP